MNIKIISEDDYGGAFLKNVILQLKNQYGYIKSSLPKYAAELDFDKLQRNCKSFKAFLNALTP
jgi:hypothetical protein